MALKMPRTVRVGPHQYSILRRKKAQMPIKDGLRQEGDCDPNTLQILIQERLKQSKAQETLLHEVWHACTYPELIGETATDEAFALATSPRLLQVIQDNPALVAYLQQKPQSRVQ